MVLSLEKERGRQVSTSSSHDSTGYFFIASILEIKFTLAPNEYLDKSSSQNTYSVLILR